MQKVSKFNCLQPQRLEKLVAIYYYELICNHRKSNRVTPKSYPSTLLIVRVGLVIDLSNDSFQSEDINRATSGTSEIPNKANHS